jgi:hypothetical protein
VRICNLIETPYIYYAACAMSAERAFLISYLVSQVPNLSLVVSS